MRRRRCWIAGWTIVVALLGLPTAASATGTFSGTKSLTFSAGTGDVNDITVVTRSAKPLVVRITDVVTMTSSIADCTVVNSKTVDCDLTSARLSFDLADGSDSFDASATDAGFTIDGGSGDDVIVGSDGDDTILGGTGNDCRTASLGIDARAGDDIVDGGLGDDCDIDGGDGIDTIQYLDGTRTGGVTVNIADGTGGTDGNVTDDGNGSTSGEDALNFENVTGSTLGDTLTGVATGSTIFGSSGADTLNGGAGDDILKGGTGADTIHGNGGTDMLSYLSDGRTIQPTGTVTVTITMPNTLPDGDTQDNVENVQGTSGDDVINGDSQARTLRGEGGKDDINGGTGSELLIGGSGQDDIAGNSGTDTASYEERTSGVVLTLTSSSTGSGGTASPPEGDVFSGIEKWFGSGGADTITGSSAIDEIDGGPGNDTLIGAAGADILHGGLGTDTASYSDRGAASPVVSSLDPAEPHQDGDQYFDIENLTGGDGNDRLTGDSGANTLDGGAGDDVLIGAAGADALIGGGGTQDIASYEERDVPIVTALTGSHPDGDTYQTIEGLGGGSQDDVLTGDSGANVLIGNDGADRLIGLGGADILKGSDFANSDDEAIDIASYEDRTDPVTATLGGSNPDGDVMTQIEGLAGGSGADRLTGDAGANTLIGNGGADTLIGAGAADLLVGGAIGGADDGATDTVSYQDGRVAGVTIDLAAGTNGDGDSYQDIQAFQGSDLADTFTGGPGDDVFAGGAGADTASGGEGADTLSGGEGADTLSGGAGNDHLLGEGGADSIDGGAGDDAIDGGADDDPLLLGGAGADTIEGGAGTDTVSYADHSEGVTVTLSAGTGDDGSASDGAAGARDTVTGVENLLGSPFDDVLIGDDLANTLNGGAGADTLTGGAGADTFDAGAGDDTVNAADGVRDSGTCGDGNDKAQLDAIDVIADCEGATAKVVVDNDGDGIAAELDCNDADPAIRPGAVEIPGNAVDENCDGIAAPFPKVDVPVSNSFAFAPTFTKVVQLDARNVAAGATIKITCKTPKKKKGCAFKSKTIQVPNATAKVSLAKLFKGKKLPVGTVIELRISEPGKITKVLRYTTRKNKVPKVTTL